MVYDPMYVFYPNCTLMGRNKLLSISALWLRKEERYHIDVKYAMQN